MKLILKINLIIRQILFNKIDRNKILFFIFLSKIGKFRQEEIISWKVEGLSIKYSNSNTLLINGQQLFTNKISNDNNSNNNIINQFGTLSSRYIEHFNFQILLLHYLLII